MKNRIITIEDAILSLRPGVEWFMDDGDIDNITWITENVQPLTKEEVEAEIVRLQQEEINREKKRLEKLESAKQKLLSIGFDIDEIAAVIGIQE